ncbi:MAG: AAA family ATPase [Gammaproteobacteria bacterium]|nr:AAA family ATPase [Gammaproteobacteria bacterium]
MKRDMTAVFVSRVRLKNFKSIAACDVALGSLSFLVGPNGSGKSNFLDALHLVRDALRSSLDHALRERGGIAEVRRRSGGHPTHFGIRLDISCAQDAGHYSFMVGTRAGGSIEVQREQCILRNSEGKITGFDVEAGEVRRCSEQGAPSASSDRLYLVNASGLPAFRPLFDALSRMSFHNLNPRLIRDLQSPQDGAVLSSSGDNLASVIGTLEKAYPAALGQIEEYLNKVVPSVHAVEHAVVGPKETLLFRQDVGLKQPWRFYAQNMSDGTLRALGIVTALLYASATRLVPLVGIEEPETALHPGATKFVREALRQASETTQVIVTSHSPDLLDDPDVSADQIYVVTAVDNATVIAPVDTASREALKQQLYSAGELLRLGQLEGDPSLFESLRETSRQSDLFQPW